MLETAQIARLRVRIAVGDNPVDHLAVAHHKALRSVL